MPNEIEKRVLHLLRQLPHDGLAAAKQLFWTELNYDHAHAPLSTRGWPDTAQDTLADPPLILAQHGGFHVIYARLSPDYPGRTFPLSITAERRVIEQLLDDHPYALFLFSDVDETHWHLVNVRYDEEATRRRVYRRVAVGPQERLRTAAERIALPQPRPDRPRAPGHPATPRPRLRRRGGDAEVLLRLSPALRGSRGPDRRPGRKGPAPLHPAPLQDTWETTLLINSRRCLLMDEAKPQSAK